MRVLSLSLLPILAAAIPWESQNLYNIPGAVGALQSRNLRSSSSLESRATRQCWHSDDCTLPSHATSVKCSSGQCVPTCAKNYNRSGDQCIAHTVISCPSPLHEYRGHCLAGPSTPTTTKSCQDASTCKTKLSNAYAVCDRGTCSVRCYSSFKWNGSKCTKDSSNPCKSDSHCAPGSKSSHLKGKCDTSSGTCGVTCSSGFTLSNGSCTQNPHSCKHTQCKTVARGYSSCSGGTCSYHCDNPAATPHCSSGRCYCYSSDSDPRHCGANNLICPGPSGAYPHHHKAKAACISGQCSFKCPNGQIAKKDSRGNPYC